MSVDTNQLMLFVMSFCGILGAFFIIAFLYIRKKNSGTKGALKRSLEATRQKISTFQNSFLSESIYFTCYYSNY